MISCIINYYSRCLHPVAVIVLAKLRKSPETGLTSKTERLLTFFSLSVIRAGRKSINIGNQVLPLHLPGTSSSVEFSVKSNHQRRQRADKDPKRRHLKSTTVGRTQNRFGSDRSLVVVHPQSFHRH